MTRQLGRAAGYDRSCWSHILLLIARNRRIVDSDLYIRWTANLIAAGQSYIGVGANDLLRASRLDFVNGSTQGFLFSMLSDSIGGKEADAQSHVMVVLQFLQSTWRDPSTRPFRRQTSSLLLERLVRYRYSDYATMLGLILRYTVNIPELQDFLVYWLRGHFVPTEALHAAMAERAR
jgi:hypothetical protein